MFTFNKVLPAIALAAALSPLAAHASSMPQPVPTQVYMVPMDMAPLHQDPITPSSATIDKPTTLYSNHAFPDSFGG